MHAIHLYYYLLVLLVLLFIISDLVWNFPVSFTSISGHEFLLGYIPKEVKVLIPAQATAHASSSTHQTVVLRPKRPRSWLSIQGPCLFFKRGAENPAEKVVCMKAARDLFCLRSSFPESLAGAGEAPVVTMVPTGITLWITDLNNNYSCLWDCTELGY